MHIIYLCSVYHKMLRTGNGNWSGRLGTPKKQFLKYLYWRPRNLEKESWFLVPCNLPESLPRSYAMTKAEEKHLGTSWILPIQLGSQWHHPCLKPSFCDKLVLRVTKTSTWQYPISGDSPLLHWTVVLSPQLLLQDLPCSWFCFLKLMLCGL